MQCFQRYFQSPNELYTNYTVIKEKSEELLEYPSNTVMCTYIISCDTQKHSLESWRVVILNWGGIGPHQPTPMRPRHVY